MTPINEARTPAQKAAACTTLAEVEGFLLITAAMLADPHTDHAYWQAVRQAGVNRRAELEKRGER